MPKNKRPTEADRLLRAVARYIEKSGGKALVIGGVGVASNDEFSHMLMIKFTGRKPPHNEIEDEAGNV